MYIYVGHVFALEIVAGVSIISKKIVFFIDIDI